MKYFPAENILYLSRLSEEALSEQLYYHVNNRSFRVWKSNDGSNKSYEGSLNGNTFTINRIISYRNSFLPVIKGNIYQHAEGTGIHVTMRLHVFVMIFMFVWCGGALLGGIGIMVQSISDGDINPLIILPFAMFLFVYLLMLGAFKFESKKSKEDLKKIFEAEIVKE